MTREIAIRYCDEYLGRHISDIDKEFLKIAKEALEQQTCDDEYIKVPKKALKYRTAGMVAYNAEWLKKHFDLERAVICGVQEPCEDATLKEIFCMGCEYKERELCEDTVSSSEKPNKCEDAISRQAVLDAIKNYASMLWEKYHEPFPESTIMEMIQELPPVTQKSETVTEFADRCRECGAKYGKLLKQELCGDYISREAVLSKIKEVCFSEEWGQFRVDNGSNGQRDFLINYIEQLQPVNPQKPKSEWEHDHEILRAYSDGASAMLDMIKAEIDEQYDRVHPYDISCAEGLEMALNIVDKYIAEEDKA